VTGDVQVLSVSQRLPGREAITSADLFVAWIYIGY